ncbi:acyl-CoA thioesterase [Halomarina rubra]|uniref:Acyl-CoA thioesterase n=1 Tax=Halomarina rubra TaxID=2071873 RepID=A0ABD6AXN6_9EURY|nr:thioesterase family protein [Halomarina rubra]
MRDYAVETTITVRYRDLDTLNHVNNAVYASYLEQARSEYFDGLADVGVGIGDGEMVIARIEIDYRAPILHEDGEVTVGTSVTDLGGSSLTFEHRITVGDRVAAEGTCIIVSVDEDGSSRPLPDSWREAIEAFEAEN